MTDYRLIIKIKNNLLFEQMKKKGIETQSELARVAGISIPEVGKVANLQKGAYGKDGTLRKASIKLCEYFGCLPEEIYPKEVINEGIPTNTIERLVSSEQINNYIEQREIDPAFQLENMIDTEFISEQIKRLTPRYQKVIKCRYYEGLTYEQTGKVLKVTGERARDMEHNALYKLRSILKFDRCDCPDRSPAGLITRMKESIKYREYLFDEHNKRMEQLENKSNLLKLKIIEQRVAIKRLKRPHA